MRVIKVEEEPRNERWIFWMVGGAAIGLAAGVLAAEKFSGKNPSPKGFLRKARGLISSARTQWGPMLSLALELREAFASRSTGDEDFEEEEFEEEDVDAVDAELDDDLDEALDADEDAEEEDAEEFDSVDEPLIGRRVLEAFENDPILAERNVEIDADDDAGTVTLFGSVRAPREVAHAVTLARGVPGVTKVRQKLEVVRRRR